MPRLRKKRTYTGSTEIIGSREELVRCSSEVFSHWYNLRTLARLLEDGVNHPASLPGRRVRETGLMMGSELGKMHGWLLRWVEVTRMSQEGK